MKEIVELIQIDFDTMENHSAAARCEKSLGMFEADTGGLSAHGKAADWLSAQPPVRLYLAWDDNIYPQIKYKRHYVQ